MTTYIDYYRPTHKGHGFLIFVALLSIAAGAVYIITHAEYFHGSAMVDQVHNCLKNYGAFKTYQEPNGTVHLLCKYPGQNTIYDRIMKLIDGQWQEASAFVPKDGLWASVQRWLLNKGGQFLAGPPPGIGY